MNQPFTIYAAVSGEIARTGSAPPDMIAMQCDVGELVWLGHADPRTTYFVQDFPTDRPAPPAIPAAWVTDTPGTMTGVDAGAQITLTDAYGTQHTFTYDPADPLILTDPGAYIVTVSQPFPAHSITQMIEVTDA